jgi:hypothetical protein
VPPRPGAVTVVMFPGSKPGIRPLTARTREGKPYTRFDEVERQIERLIQAPAHMWPSLVRDGIEGHSVKNEAIVYLVRDAWHRGQDSELLELHTLLFDRMATTALNRAGKMGLSDAVPLIEALQSRIQKWNRKHSKYWQRLDIDAAVPEKSVIEHSTRLSATSIDRIEAEISAEIIIENARKWLAAPHFEAFYLHYVKGMPVEAKQGSGASLVDHFHRPASTIYFWLDKAVEIIRNRLSIRPEA